MAQRLTRPAIWLLIGGLVVRLLLAWWLPLGIDESYAIAVAREFSWAFFDHPPIGFWLPVAMANLSGMETPLIYRLPFLVCGTVTAWAIWQLGYVLGGAKSANWALVLWTIAPYMMIGGGLFVVPDGPLNMGLALSALAMTRALDRGRLTDWIWVGVWLAIAMASKYQAALYPVAVLAFLLLTKGQWQRMLTSGPWIGAGIGLAGLLPVVLWNLQNDWVSFAFHTARVGAQFQPGNFAAMLSGQLLYLLPPVFVVALVGFWTSMARHATLPHKMLGWTGGLTVAVFMGMFLYGNATFPHWTMPGWLLLLPLGGDWIARHGGRITRLIFTGFAVPVWVLIAVLALHVQTGVLTRSAPSVPKWDNTAEMFDFSGLPAAVSALGWRDEADQIAVLDWIEAGQISTAYGGSAPVKVIGPSPHHFQFMQAANDTGPALLLVHGYGTRLERHLAQAQSIEGAEFLGQFKLLRGDQPYLTVYGFHLPDTE